MEITTSIPETIKMEIDNPFFSMRREDGYTKYVKISDDSITEIKIAIDGDIGVNKYSFNTFLDKKFIVNKCTKEDFTMALRKAQMLISEIENEL